jgi:putative ABC transport system permease protein
MDRLYSMIKILGLAVGMTFALLAILYIRDETSFDRFQTKADRLYRITTIINNPLDGGSKVMGATGQVQGPSFKNKIPEIEDYVRVKGGLSTNFIANDKALSLNFIYADQSFFDVFSFPLLYGSRSDALAVLNAVVITERTALRFFGRTDVVGQTIKLEEGHGMASFMITGVAKDVPVHSSIQFEAVLPFKYMQTMFRDETWLNSYLSTFVLLRSHADISKIENEFAGVFREEAADQLMSAKMSPGQVQFGLQPMVDIHLNEFSGNASPVIGRGNLNESSSLIYSYILSGIAALILIMAIINFLNLSIAGSLKRSKEVAIRKVSGGSRRQIAVQFLTEASVLCIAAYLLAIVLITAFLPVFNRLAQKEIRFLFPSDIVFFIYGLILNTLCVLLIGLYPAIKLSLFNPVEILYNKQKFGGRNFFNRGLTVVQFTLAISLLIATIIYYKQMGFISRSDLGYDGSDVARVDLPNFRHIDRQTIETLRHELNAEPSIIQMANGDLTTVNDGDVETNGNKISTQQMWIDQFFLNVSGLRVREGRNFSDDFGSDSVNSVIVNETFIRQARLEHPIGQQVKFIDWAGASHPRTIVGVVKDFHYGSLKEKIQPVALFLQQSDFIWVKLQKGNTTKALSHLQSIFNRSFPQYFYQYSFVEDEIGNQYADDQRWKQIITYASALAICICCVGLIGLVNFETLRRRKEIAVRKVLGSSVINISLLLSRDFLKLVVLAIIIASPIAWYTMNRWLQNFAYRTNISWLDFAISTFSVLLIALATVNIRAVGAAIASPLKSLRTE